MSSHERSGWRDESLSLRHRLWGFNCPATDADFVMVEYDQKHPIAIVDYKLGERPIEWFRDANTETLGRLWGQAMTGEIVPLPFFMVFYDTDFERFRVHPMNETAKAFLCSFKLADPFVCTESIYVKFLYALRGRAVTQSIVSDLEWLRTNPHIEWKELHSNELRMMRKTEKDDEDIA